MASPDGRFAAGPADAANSTGQNSGDHELRPISIRAAGYARQVRRPSPDGRARRDKATDLAACYCPTGTHSGCHAFTDCHARADLPTDTCGGPNRHHGRRRRRHRIRAGSSSCGVLEWQDREHHGAADAKRGLAICRNCRPCKHDPAFRGPDGPERQDRHRHRRNVHERRLQDVPAVRYRPPLTTADRRPPSAGRGYTARTARLTRAYDARLTSCSCAGPTRPHTCHRHCSGRAGEVPMPRTFSWQMPNRRSTDSCSNWSNNCRMASPLPYFGRTTTTHGPPASARSIASLQRASACLF